MFFKQIYEPGLAHASYMVGCQKTGECLVIDAKRDIDTYLEIAKRERLKITHLTETHIHADFLSGTRELAQKTNAKMLLSNEGGADWQYEFAHEPLKDTDTFMVGNIKIEVMHTPGHTPEHISFLATDTPATGDVPIMIFTGDFVFVGDIGRPDLLEKAAGLKGTMEKGAHEMWHSLEKFKTLPDHIQVHPAHGAGSACGKALGAIPSSTVGYEKLVNWAFQHDNEDEFVKELLSGQPEPPKYFAMMKKLNKVDRPLLVEVPEVPELSLDDAISSLKKGEHVIDTRHKVSFAGGHLHGAVNIQNNKSLSNWTGWILNYEDPFVVVAGSDKIEDITRKLMRIGLDNLSGYITPDADSWIERGQELDSTPHIELTELQARLGDPDLFILDVRGASEYQDGHIPGAVNIHVGHLSDRLDEIPTDKVVIVACQSGDRSSIASSLLQKMEFKNVVNFPPGFAGWQSAGAPVEKEPVLEDAS